MCMRCVLVGESMAHVWVAEEVCVKEMAACAADETCKGLHMKVQTLMKKDSGYGGKDGDKKEGYGDNKGAYADKKEGYGAKKEGGYGGRQLHQHGAHPVTKDGEKKPQQDGEKKPMPQKEGEPSAELKAAMEACKKNEYCRALMECKMKHKESGGKGDHGDKGLMCSQHHRAWVMIWSPTPST